MVNRERNSSSKVLTGVVLLLLLLMALPARSEDKIELTVEQHQALLGHLKNLQAIEAALPEIILDPIFIYRDKVGRYYLPENVKLKLSLAYLNYEADVQLPARIETKPRRAIRITNRLQVGIMADDTFQAGLALAYELMAIYRLSLHGYLTRRVLGAGVGMSVTNNCTILVGAGLAWTEIMDPRSGTFRFGAGVVLGF